MSQYFIQQKKSLLLIQTIFLSSGKKLVNKQSGLVERKDEKKNDGNIILHNLYERYTYDGDLQIYQSKILFDMNQKFTRNYPEGPI